MRGLAVTACSCALTVALLLGWAWRHRAWLQQPIVDSGYVEGVMVQVLREWAARPPTTPGAVLLGNSLTICVDGASVGELTARRLAERNAPYALATPWGGGLGPVQYYYLLDEILAGRPAFVILQVDPIRLVSSGRAPGLLYLAMSRYLSFGRAFAIRTALASEGVTLFDPFLYRLEARLGVSYVVPGVQDHWQGLLARWGDTVNDRIGIWKTRFNVRGLQREMNLESARTILQHDPNDILLVPVLRVIADQLRRAGVVVLFYVSPMNDAILGPPASGSKDLIRRWTDRLRMAVGAAPEEWVDLHDALPPDAFRDRYGHMHPVGCERVSEVLADAVMARPVGR